MLNMLRICLQYKFLLTLVAPFSTKVIGMYTIICTVTVIRQYVCKTHPVISTWIGCTRLRSCNIARRTCDAPVYVNYALLQNKTKHTNIIIDFVSSATWSLNKQAIYLWRNLTFLTEASFIAIEAVTNECSVLSVSLAVSRVQTRHQQTWIWSVRFMMALCQLFLKPWEKEKWLFKSSIFKFQQQLKTNKMNITYRSLNNYAFSKTNKVKYLLWILLSKALRG